MNILVLGDAQIISEFKSKFDISLHYYQFETNYQFDYSMLENIEVIFDFHLDETPENFDLYKDLPHLTVFVNAPKMSMSRLVFFHGEINCTLFGINGLPTMLNRTHLEVSLFNKKDLTALETVCKSLNVAFLAVDDRVGMVTPRVIAMIINEAYYTVQEGTASREDIDLGMKLGTNYPYGPFAFCKRIGLKHIYEILEAVYEDTKDERYKVCPLLKKEYLIENKLFALEF